MLRKDAFFYSYKTSFEIHSFFQQVLSKTSGLMRHPGEGKELRLE